MTKNDCFLCDKIETGWSKESLTMIREMFKLCKKHLEVVENGLSKQPEEANTVSKPSPEFLPPIVEQPKHYTEHEPGSDDV